MSSSAWWGREGGDWLPTAQHCSAGDDRPQSSPHPSHPFLLTEGQGALPLTSIVLSPIHLIIHIHGQFLKQPVAELEAEKGTQGLSGWCVTRGRS